MPLHRLFFYLTVLLLPTQLGLHFWPDWALVIGRRLDYLSPTIFLTDITIVLTLTSWFFLNKENNIYKIILRAQREVFYTICKSSHFVRTIISIFIIFIALNIFLASSPLIALLKWLKVLEFILFGFYIVKTRPSFSRSLWCLSFAVFYSSIIAIAQFFLQHSVGGPLWFLGERTFTVDTPGIARGIFLFPYFKFQISNFEFLRPYATFPHPNVLGGFLAVALPLIIFNNMTPLFNKLLLSQRVKRLSLVDKAKPWAQRTIGSLKLFRVSTIILGCFALILTFSRSAWVVFIALFVLLKIKNWNFISNFKFQISNLYVLIVLAVLVGFSLPYFQTLTAENESVYIRNELSNAAISIWKTSPIIGVGLGNFLVELPTYYPHREIFFLQPVHNIYLLLLSEVGIIGLSFFLYFLWKIYTTRSRSKFSPYLLVSLSLCLLLGFVDHYPLTLQQGQLVLTLLLAFCLTKY